MLTINSHFYTIQRVEAVPTFKEEGVMQGTQLQIDFDIQKGEEENPWNAVLVIKSDDERSTNPPYKLHFESICFFSFEKEVPEEKALRATILQMMAGSARERIITMTGRGPWPKFSLGPVPIDVAWKKMNMEETKSAPEKK